jgi:opacity protein-like surface antigen
MLHTQEAAMRTLKIPVVLLMALAGVLLGSRASSAEWFADVYAGASLTRDNDVTIHDRVAGQGVYRHTEFATALAYGFRLGRYFDQVPFLGVAVDLFNFSPTIRAQGVNRDGCFVVTGCGSGEGHTGRIEITTHALSADVMLRLPLFKTAQEPNGVLQPYITAGVPLFITTVTPRTTREFRNHDDDTNISFGYKAAAGVAFKIFSNLHLFGEYRYTHTNVSADLHDAVTRNASLDTDLNTHSFLLGLSARW